MCPPLRANGFLPDYAGLPEATLERLAARLYLLALQSRRRGGGRGLLAAICSLWPSAMISSCWRTNAMPISISTSRPSPRLPARLAAIAAAFRRLLTFHSLSKRSGLPGLRSGMVAGDADLIARFRAFRNVAGPQMPGPCWPPAPPAGATKIMWRPIAPPMPRRWRRPNASWAIGCTRPARRLFPLAGDRQWRGDRAADCGGSRG